jgi:hypothetical protein
MRYLLSLLLCCSAFGAAGDITSATVLDNGWQLQVVISGTETNGAFANGLGANNTLTGSEGATVTVLSPGFNDDATTNQTTRILYGTKLVRFPHPNHAYSDTTTDGSSVTIKIALSDYIYNEDLVTVDFADGMYSTNALSSASASSVSVVNNSTQAYPKVIANWSWRGFRVIDTEHMDLRAVAFHFAAKDGKPVARVEFRVRDSGDNWFTNALTSMEIDRSMPDAHPVPEYVGRFATNTLASGLVECNVRVWPWIGTEAHIFDSANQAEFAKPYCIPLTNAVNYPRVRAFVNASTGNDTTGIAATEEYWSGNNSPNRFATIAGAVNRIYTTNAAFYSRPGTSGGLIFVEAGSYNFLGATVTHENGPDVECVIQAAPGTARADVIISGVNDARAKDDADIWRIKNMTIDIGSTASVFSRHNQTWFDGCHWLSATATRSWGASSGAMSGIFTHCTVTNLTQGFRGFSSDPTAATLVRGNEIQGSVPFLVAYTVLGNTRTTNQLGSFSVVEALSGMNATRHADVVVGYNSFHALTGSAGFSFNTYAPTNSGWAIVNNVFEHCGSAGGNDNYTLVTSSTLHATNVIFWNNNMLGARLLKAYNSTGTDPAWRVGWSVHNNITDYQAIKSDIFTTASGNRIGNWASLYGVGYSGSANLNTVNFSAAFDAEFSGLGSWIGNDSPTNYSQFSRIGSFSGEGTALSGGDYRILSSSPLLRQTTTKHVLPFDIEGNARSAFDPPGAYSSASPRKGAGFF